MTVQTTRLRRCSLIEGHGAHAGSDSTGMFRCDGLSPKPPRPAPVPMLRYVLPLGPSRPRAEMLLPEDLTAWEASRLAAMVATLPLPVA